MPPAGGVMRPFAPNRSPVNRGGQTPDRNVRGGTATPENTQEQVTRPSTQEPSPADRGEQMPGGVGSGIP